MKVNLDYRICDERLSEIASDFVFKLRRLDWLLSMNGYLPSTIETFLAAQKIVKDNNSQAVERYIRNNPKIDYATLDIITALYREGNLKFVMLNYPILGDFECFYFCSKDLEVNDMVEEMGYSHGKTEKVNDSTYLRDVLVHIKLTSNDDLLRERVDWAIEVIDSVSSFVAYCDDIVEEVQEVFHVHASAMNEDLATRRKVMYANRYEAYRNEQVRGLQSLSDRFVHAIRILRDMNVN